MTQEQKEQLAKEGVTIATNTKRVTQEDLYHIILWALNARDEEVGTLEGLLKINEHEIKQLKAKLAKAQNPWISVEDNLPNPHTPVYAKNDKRTWFFALRTDNRVRPWYDIVGRHPEEVTHWKPIQPLKGGEK